MLRVLCYMTIRALRKHRDAALPRFAHSAVLVLQASSVFIEGVVLECTEIAEIGERVSSWRVLVLQASRLSASSCLSFSTEIECSLSAYVLPRESSFECIELLSIQPRDPVARGRVEGGEGRVEGGRRSYEGGRGGT